tara:strand:- start:70 stop:315 length:246 start_codon:yes stop_codon:yes gene_type:complete
MKTPQITPEWKTGIYIGNGVVAKNETVGFDETRQGLRIDTIPDTRGALSGNYSIDFHGCWWEVNLDAGGITNIIGEYPDND